MTDYYQIGYDSFMKDRQQDWSWECTPRGKEHYQNTMTADERSTWLSGREAALQDLINPQAKYFLDEIHLLEQKYNAKICTGCGCCGGGYYITVDGAEYQIYNEN